MLVWDFLELDHDDRPLTLNWQSGDKMAINLSGIER